jgi:hypothetical protein
MSKETKLYRYYDASGALLYVGISKHALQRLTEHEADKHWQADISSVRIENFPDRETAHAAERKAIVSEHPTHNLIRYTARPSIPRKPTRRADAGRPHSNAICLAALTSMYEEMHWSDFVDKYSHTDGDVITLTFRRNPRIESLAEEWMRDAKYAFEHGSRLIVITLGTCGDDVEVSLARERCSASQVEKYGLKMHDALHEALCADAPRDEARRYL